MQSSNNGTILVRTDQSTQGHSIIPPRVNNEKNDYQKREKSQFARSNVHVVRETSINRTNHSQNRILPSIERISVNDIRDLVYQKKKKRKVPNVFHRRCCILCLVITIMLLLAAILATVLALLLKHPSTVSTKSTTITTTTATTATTSSTTSETSTTSTTETSSTSTTSTTTTSESTSSSSTTTSSTTTTETTTICTSASHGTLLSLNGLNPSGSLWTPYQFNYTATSSSHILMFGFRNDNNREYYLDDGSIVDNSAPSIELLQNPKFENSTTVATGWVQWCTNTCSGHQGIITVGSSCYSGNCFMDNCYASSGIDFIGQSFSTIINQTYTISFMLKLGGSGTTTSNAFYADIL